MDYRNAADNALANLKGYHPTIESYENAVKNFNNAAAAANGNASRGDKLYAVGVFDQVAYWKRRNMG